MGPHSASGSCHDGAVALVIRQSSPSGLHGDRGSVLLLSIGLFTVVVAFFAVVADVAAIRMARQELLAHADAAVLAAVKAVDVEALIDDGYVEVSGMLLVPIDRDRAVAAVQDHLSASGAHDRFRGLTIERLSVDKAQASLHLAATVRPPFTHLVTTLTGVGRDIPISAVARARTQVG
jgi:hypothetical protein